MFGFVEGSYFFIKSNERNELPKRLRESYNSSRIGSCQTGFKFLLNKYTSLGLSVKYENSKLTTNFETFEMPFYIDTFNLQDVYLKTTNQQEGRFRSIELMPSFAIYKPIGKSGVLLFEFAYYRQYGNGNQRHVSQGFNYQDSTRNFTEESFYKNNRKFWGFSFKPYFILKGYKRFYISYSPLSFSYSQPVKKHSNQNSNRSFFETSFNPISLGLFFKLN
jgi:hypothetical protein